MIYHNITPPDFFKKFDTVAYNACKQALRELNLIHDKFDYCLADSEFNKRDLEKVGFTCKIDVLPILLNYQDYYRQPSEKVIKDYSCKFTKIVSIGRINAPNKKWENVIRTFYFYQKYVDPKAHLFLVGSYNENDLYPRLLMSYVNELGLKNVIFTGHIPFNEILAYLKIADIYLCMSEHEGFCVPLLEAMLFEKPVVAYSSTAIPYTLGDAGFLLENNDPLEAALVIKRILNDSVLKNEILEKQNERLLYFKPENIKGLFEKYIKTFIKN
jgi:glycosyltransferase involved in cell wall biosynthesis